MGRLAQLPEWKIFKYEKDEGTRNVHLDWSGVQDSSFIAEGFRDSARLILVHYEEDARHPDRFFFSVAYLYRHSVEIMLKEIIVDGRNLNNEPLRKEDKDGKDVTDFHNLHKLWNEALRLLEIIYAGADKAPLDEAWAILKELHDADPNGVGFRYKKNMKGEVNLENIPRVFSLTTFVSQLETLYDFLDGCLLGIGAGLDRRAECAQ